MADYDLVVRNGTLATASDVFRADIGVIDGRIATLGAKLGAGRREINAEGRIVTPGGVDSHCHIEQRSSMGVMTADDFFTATRSAACGGTTTVIPFAAQYRGMSLRQVVKDYHACAEPKAAVDYAFHLIISDPSEQVTGQELPALIKDGYTSFKIYTTYDALKLDDRQILDVLSVARRERALVMVHAENHDVISWLADKMLAAGHSSPRFHAMAHAPIAEREATSRAISLAEIVDVPILIVHVSAREAMEQIRQAKARGLKVYGETCPQYLFLTADDLDRPGFEGAKYMCSPPPRDKANQEVIWQGLATGVFDVFSSDHAGYRYDDPEGKMKHGRNAPFKEGGEWRARPRSADRAPVLGRRRQGTHRPAKIRRADIDQRRQALRPPPAQGHHRGRQRRGPGDLGSRQRGHHPAVDDPRRDGLHALRGQDDQGLADHDAGARRGGRRRRRIRRRGRQRPVPEVRYLTCNRAARTAHDPV